MTILLCVSFARAQEVWSSDDQYTHYVVLDFSDEQGARIMLKDKHRPALDFLSDIFSPDVVDKIRAKEYRIWVESYALVDGNSIGNNKDLARQISNVVKSHLILSQGVVEDDFTTKNYSGMFDAMRMAAIVVVGLNYPDEQFSLRANVDRSTDHTTQQSKVDPSHYDRQLSRQKIEEYGVDTMAILSPRFEVMKFGRDTLCADMLEPIEQAPSTELNIYAQDAGFERNTAPGSSVGTNKDGVMFFGASEFVDTDASVTKLSKKEQRLARKQAKKLRK